MKYNTFALSKEKCKEYNKNQMNDALLSKMW